MNIARTLCIAAPLVAAIFAAAACAADRNEFDTGAGFGGEDAFAPPPDAPECLLQCSLDGRKVIETCTGEAVKECPPELACGEGTCQDPCKAAAADKRSEGCDFYFQTARFKKNYAQSCYAVFVVNTSTLPLDIKLDLGGEPLDVSKSLYRTNPGDATLIPNEGALEPGRSAVLFVSDRPAGIPMGESDSPCPKDVVAASYSDTLPNGTGYGTAFHMTTNVPASVTSMYPFGGAPSALPSATLVLPVSTWATQHIIVNGWEASDEGVPSAQMIASEDDTEVTIIPTKDIQDNGSFIGSRARVPVTYHLAKGQILQLAQVEELSGSTVTSTKPIALTGGNSCANVPASGGWCDILYQQIPGVDQWGSEYVGVGYRPRMGNEHEPLAYRIVAARDGTMLDYDPVAPPGAPLSLAAGEVATFLQGTGDAFVVRTQDPDHPIYVAAYMSGALQGFDGFTSYQSKGDPEFVNVVPAGQFLSSYSFYADPTYGDTSLVVVRAKSRGEFKDVWLECAGNLTGFRPIGTKGEYEYVRVDLANNNGPGDKFGDKTCRTGLQQMRSDGPFTATLWGWAYAASYAYPGGMAQRKLLITPFDPVH